MRAKPLALTLTALVVIGAGIVVGVEIFTPMSHPCKTLTESVDRVHDGLLNGENLPLDEMRFAALGTEDTETILLTNDYIDLAEDLRVDLIEKSGVDENGDNLDYLDGDVDPKTIKQNFEGSLDQIDRMGVYVVDQC